jgi:acyl-CoA reductase-like NAD-dependent aldehyde dehydrogenase
VLVAEDADLPDVLPRLTKGAFYHAGQVCVSVQRVYAVKPVFGEVALGIAALARRLRVGDPVDPQTEVGPMIRTRDVDRIEEWVQEAVRGGAELICGGKRLSDSLYAPTVLLDPPPGARVSVEEVFGPVVCVYPVETLDDGIRSANSLPVAFQAAICTRSIDTALRAFRRLDASAVLVNEHTAFRADWMPFQGLKESGLGVGGIPFTMADMQIEKMLVLQSPEL